MIDPVLNACGVVNPELNEEEKRSVQTQMEYFFRAGGVITLRDWAQLTVESKTLLIAAAEQVNNPDVLRIANVAERNDERNSGRV